MDAFLETIPLIVAMIVPPLFAMLRMSLLAAVPSQWIPVLLPVAGGVLSGLGSLVGVEVDPSGDDPGVWGNAITGVLVGFAAVGIHQIKSQRDEAKESE